MNILICLLLVAGGCWLFYSSRNDIRLGLGSYRWLATEGLIVDSGDVSFTIDGLDSTSTGVVPVDYQERQHVYTYEVAGERYRGNTYCYGAYCDRVAAEYPIGTKVTVYYDPGNPQISVLSRGVKLGPIIGLIPIVVAVVYAVLVF